jgi:hypothetical protein
VFAIPVVLAAGSAGVVSRLNRYVRFRSFGRFAAAAAVGLLAVTLAALARPVVELHPALLGGALAVFAAERFGLSPVLLLAIAIGAGAAAGVAGF